MLASSSSLSDLRARSLSCISRDSLSSDEDSDSFDAASSRRSIALSGRYLSVIYLSDSDTAVLRIFSGILIR